MKIIVIDGQVLHSGNMDGIHRFMIEILSRLDRMIEGSTELELHLVHSNTDDIKNLTLKNIKVVALDSSKGRYHMKLVPEYVKQVGGIYCSMSNDAIRLPGSIFTIMDLIPINKQFKYPFKAKLRMRLTYMAMKKFHRRIVTISEESKKDIVNLLGIKEDHIDIVPCGHEHMDAIGSDDSIFETDSRIVKGGYYYAVGNQYPYKNYRWVVEAAKYNKDAVFVVAGGKLNISEDIGLAGDNIIYVGRVSDEVNRSLMEGAKAFIHPSKLEGFGIPPMEALYLGTPAIVSSASCLPEIYGDTVHYIDPDDAKVNLDDLLKEPVESPEKLFEKYNWDKAARDWLNIFKSM